ncbi:unnamed protein product [Rotaria sp. Silwood2]|nr:unnamed protein product [Rotaria sp. Silwood2]
MGRKAVDSAIKRSIIVLRDSGMSQHEISRKLKIFRHCVQQTIRKFNELHTLAIKSGAGHHSKLTDRQKRAVKLQQVRDDTLSLTDLVRFRNDLKRFERSQQRVHRGGGVDKYIDILDKHLPTAFEKFLSHSSHEILLQQDNARPHVSIKTRKYFKKKHLHPIPWRANSTDLNLIENIWSMLDDKLLKFNINNTEQLKTAMQMAWLEISNDTVRKLFESMPKRIQQVINRRGFAYRYESFYVLKRNMYQK